MAYSKGGGSMTSPKGMCSTKTNPMKQASKTSSMCGPGGNADQNKANRLLQKQLKSGESLRGAKGM